MFQAKQLKFEISSNPRFGGRSPVFTAGFHFQSAAKLSGFHRALRTSLPSRLGSILWARLFLWVVSARAPVCRPRSMAKPTHDTVCLLGPCVFRVHGSHAGVLYCSLCFADALRELAL